MIARFHSRSGPQLPIPRNRAGRIHESSRANGLKVPPYWCSIILICRKQDPPGFPCSQPRRIPPHLSAGNSWIAPTIVPQEKIRLFTESITGRKAAVLQKVRYTFWLFVMTFSVLPNRPTQQYPISICKQGILIKWHRKCSTNWIRSTCKPKTSRRKWRLIERSREWQGKSWLYACWFWSR